MSKGSVRKTYILDCLLNFTYKNPTDSWNIYQLFLLTLNTKSLLNINLKFHRVFRIINSIFIRKDKTNWIMIIVQNHIMIYGSNISRYILGCSPKRISIFFRHSIFSMCVCVCIINYHRLLCILIQHPSLCRMFEPQ